MKSNYATLESQLGNNVCTVEDTEEIFCLRMSDDYRSKVKAGDFLVKQYRFKDAITEYLNALEIKKDDFMLYIKLGGAYLTLFKYEEAEKYYNKALEYAAKEETVAFYFGVMEFLKASYSEAISYFEKVNTNNGEMLISVIYWHTIASFKNHSQPSFLEKYNENIDVGHHTAYKTAVSLFADKIEYNNIIIPKNSLDAVIVQYGICEYLKHKKQTTEIERYAEQLLIHTDVWPCIAYLAAYNDRINNQNVK
jgi:tetratricopeptide (TPR) repeat protein